MSNITAREKGRKLELTIGADEDEDKIVVLVPPVNTSTGAALLALWAGILFAQSEQPEVDAENLGRIAVGEENWEIVNELRSAESSAIINAAIFWNSQGGGIEIVEQMLRDGLPKARTALAEANGLAAALSALQTLLDGASVSQTPSPVVTPDTPIQVGISGSFGTLHPTSQPHSKD